MDHEDRAGRKFLFPRPEFGGRGVFGRRLTGGRRLAAGPGTPCAAFAAGGQLAAAVWPSPGKELSARPPARLRRRRRRAIFGLRHFGLPMCLALR